MKKLITLLSMVVFTATAQKEISAKTIFEQIDSGKKVEYENATIVGNLDLTELSNKRKINSKYSPEYKSRVEVPLIFRNCRFNGDLIAYKNIEDGKVKKIGGATISWDVTDGEVYTTDFEQTVVFENCTFTGKTEFKYSDFNENATFGGSKFEKDANFKYSEFKREAVFAKTDFENYANFKYAKFQDDADFFDVRFKETADFKYANFDDRATFKNTLFSQNADFKYAEFASTAIFDKTNFKQGVDFKYSNGKKYLDR